MSSGRLFGDRPVSPGLSRRDRRKQETRARILDAAAELFGEQGVHSTKISEVCDRADIAHQTFFNHFLSKGSLLLELSQAGVDFVAATMEAACQQRSSTRERLQIFFETMSTATLEVGPMHRELMAEVIYASQDAHDMEPSRRVHDSFDRLIRLGLELGDVTTRHEPEVLVQLAVGAYFVLMSDCAVGLDFDLERRSGQIAELLADSLERRPGDEGSE